MPNDKYIALAIDKITSGYMLAGSIQDKIDDGIVPGLDDIHSMLNGIKGFCSSALMDLEKYGKSMNEPDVVISAEEKDALSEMVKRL